MLARLFGTFDDALDVILVGSWRAARRRPLFAGLVVLALVALGGALWCDGAPAAGDDAEVAIGSYFFDRPYFDKFPSDEQAKYHIYFFTKKGLAIYAELQYYREEDEFFFFKAVLDRCFYWFPHSKLKGMTPVAVADCEGPGSFDLKLTVKEDPKRNKKERVFYSWRSFQRDGLPAWMQTRLTELERQAERRAAADVPPVDGE